MVEEKENEEETVEGPWAAPLPRIPATLLPLLPPSKVRGMAAV